MRTPLLMTASRQAWRRFISPLMQRLVHSRNRREWHFALSIAAVCLVLALVDLSPKSPSGHGLHARALVTEVDNSNVRINLIVKTEFQVLKARLLSGPHRGKDITVVNNLTGTLELDEYYEPGAVILVEYKLENGEPQHVSARGHERLQLQLLLVGLFAALLILVAGVTGLKAMLSFVFAALLLWKLYFPLLLLGYPPLLTGIVLVAILTGVITFSVGGLNRRGISTFTGAMLGVLLTCGLAVWFGQAFHLHGAVRPFAESLLYAGYTSLPLTKIFIASIFIASSGAVMDLAMDIAASMEEIQQANPDIGLIAHIAAGLRVGRAVIGTMTTTLLLAYSSSHITMFLLFIAKGLPAANVLNSPLVSAEIMNILVGSFGLIAVAPITAIVSGLVYRWGRPEVAPATAEHSLP